MQLFEVTESCIATAIAITNGGTAAGDVTVGIYGPVVTEETCAGAPVLVEAASIPQSGTSASQEFPITATVLNPGRYYVAVELGSE